MLNKLLGSDGCDKILQHIWKLRDNAFEKVVLYPTINIHEYNDVFEKGIVDEVCRIGGVGLKDENGATRGYGGGFHWGYQDTVNSIKTALTTAFGNAVKRLRGDCSPSITPEYVNLAHEVVAAVPAPAPATVRAVAA